MDIKFGYGISSEQSSPSEIIEIARLSENSGLDFVFVSDHFHPWVDAQGQSAFVWNLIGAISQVTNRIIVGTGVTCPIIRFHPVVMAQAAATSAVMLNGRFIFGIGTGENLNEHVVGAGWPRYTVRRDMIIEAIEIFNLLFQGGFKSYSGEYFDVDNARLYTLPDEPPPIILSAFGPKSAKVAGEMTDGLITAMADKKVIETFEQTGGEGKPKYALLTCCYSEDKEEAKKSALRIWPNGGLSGQLSNELRLPSEFQAASEPITADQLEKEIIMGNDIERFLEQINKYVEAGITHIYFNNIGHNYSEFINFYTQKVIPAMK